VKLAPEGGAGGFASTPYAWGDSKWERYDYGLGMQTYGKKHRDSVMKSMGLVEGFRSAR
jgi:hypothetical protein